jgi:hypothetical protein
MTDEEGPIELSLPVLLVAETHRLFRLSPAAVDYLKSSIQTALVPADTEGDARRIATETNPLGQDWRDQTRFVADSIVTTESHVIGDIICQTSRRRP